MDQTEVDRRLSAILAADVVGYSRLMGTDEEGTLRLLKRTRAELVKIDKVSDDFSLIEITDLTGRVLATSRSGTAIDAAGQAWFRTAAAGRPARAGRPRRAGW